MNRNTCPTTVDHPVTPLRVYICDGCGLLTVTGGVPLGWQVSGDEVLCPVCAREREAA